MIIGERENISVFVDTARDRDLSTVLDIRRIIGTAGFDPRLFAENMGRLIKNHWARLIILTAAMCKCPRNLREESKGNGMLT